MSDKFRLNLVGYGINADGTINENQSVVPWAKLWCGAWLKIAKERDDLEVNFVPSPSEFDSHATDSILNAPPCDAWYCMTAMDIAIFGIDEHRSEPIFAHAHGAEHDGVYRLDLDCVMPSHPMLSQSRELRIDMTRTFNTLAGLTTNSKHHVDLLQAYHTGELGLRLPPTAVVGFPMDFSSYPQVNETIKTKVIVPHRLSPTKNLQVVAEALYPLRDRVIFATAHSCADLGTYERDYMHRLQLTGYTALPNCKGNLYRRLLSEAKVVVACSSADTLCLGVTEAMACGAIPVVPNKGPFDEYANGFYFEPYDIKQMLDCVERALMSPVPSERKIMSAIAKYDAKVVAEKSLAFIKATLKDRHASNNS